MRLVCAHRHESRRTIETQTSMTPLGLTHIEIRLLNFWTCPIL
jgi:hypothetical protein